MRRVLITAFDPFGGDEKNSSMMTLERLPEKVGETEIFKMIVPTVYDKCADFAWEKAKECGAEAILAMGQAGGRRGVSLEAAALNYALSDTPDNAGEKRRGVKLSENGENAYFSTLPIKNMTEAAKRAGYDAFISVSAGAFVCNSMLYFLLKAAEDEKSKIKCAFVHLPFAKEQGKDDYSLSVEKMADCVSIIINSMWEA